MKTFLAFAAGALGAALGLIAAPAAAQPPDAQRPSLVVMIVVDQFSANLFNQHRAHFTGGFRDLIDHGRVYANGYHTHAGTETCPGHATVLTGAHPTRVGIPANEWFDVRAGDMTYCLTSETATLAHVPPGGEPTDNGPVSPERMQVSTLGDWLKAVSPQSRVFTISGKDRGAIALGGHQADGSFWFTDDFGFTTYVRPGESATERLAPVAGFNARLTQRLRDQPVRWDYTSEDCRSLEADWTVSGRPYRAALPPARPRFDVTPALDEVTLEGAAMLLETQQLGRRGVTDVLGVSLSATDRIGHRFGTQGPEMCEQMRRLDAALGQFLDRLSDIPGVVVALTADHGGGDFPERWAAMGFSEARWDGQDLPDQLNEAMRERFGLDHDPIRPDGLSLYVVGPDGLGMAEPMRGEIARGAADWLIAQPGVATAFTLEDIMTQPAPGLGWGPQEMTLLERQRLSAVPGRSGDVIFVQPPGVSRGAGRPGSYVSGHGTPWDYDRRVPILFWTPDGRGEERTLAIRTVDIAPTLAALIGAAPLNEIDGRCLELGYGEAVACPAQAAP